jgi:hypothetical protein
MRKILFCAGILIFTANAATAQFYKSLLPSPAFTDSLNRIVVDFNTNYYNIQGDVVSSQDEVDVYNSKSSIPGAIECLIYRFHSSQDTTASLQALMYKGEDYKEAAKIYRNTFRLVNKTKLKVNQSSADFTGTMEEPSESLRFASSLLRTTIPNRTYKNFVAEIELVNNFMEWEVRLNLHSKRDDKEKYDN